MNSSLAVNGDIQIQTIAAPSKRCATSKLLWGAGALITSGAAVGAAAFTDITSKIPQFASNFTEVMPAVIEQTITDITSASLSSQVVLGIAVTGVVALVAKKVLFSKSSSTVQTKTQEPVDAKAEEPALAEAKEDDKPQADSAHPEKISPREERFRRRQSMKELKNQNQV